VASNTRNTEHSQETQQAIDAGDGYQVRKISDRTFQMHEGGKIQTTSKVNLRNSEDLSRAYTPGVARVCSAIAQDVHRARELTIKRNTIAVVTDGTAVLGEYSTMPVEEQN